MNNKELRRLELALDTKERAYILNRAKTVKEQRVLEKIDKINKDKPKFWRYLAIGSFLVGAYFLSRFLFVMAVIVTLENMGVDMMIFKFPKKCANPLNDPL